MGLISTGGGRPSSPGPRAANPSSRPSVCWPPSGATLSVAVSVLEVRARADRPGVTSARDAMPEAAANTSGKSFLQRASSKVLRWLRRSLRSSHQVTNYPVTRSGLRALTPPAHLHSHRPAGDRPPRATGHASRLKPLRVLGPPASKHGQLTAGELAPVIGIR